LGGFFDQGDDGCLLGIRTNFEPDLIALPTNQTNDGGTIGFHCAPPAPLVGPLTWGRGGIIVLSWSFMTAILVHFVHFKRLILQFYRQAISQPLLLDPMSPLEQVAVIPIQFQGDLGGRITLDNSAQQQHDFTATETDPAQHHFAENVEHPPTPSTFVGHDWLSVTFVRFLLRGQAMSLGTTQSCWVQHLGQEFITFSFIHQIIYWKSEHFVFLLFPILPFVPLFHLKDLMSLKN
jgi:hypothetical protein